MKSSIFDGACAGTVFALILCVIWMTATGIIGTLGLYESPRNGSHLSIIISVLTPTIFFVILFISLSAVRAWTVSLDLAMLALPHAWRTIGFSFLALWFYKVLPSGFAAPAGFGDFGIAIAAPFVVVALWQNWSGAVSFALWFNILGLMDLFFALLTGITAYGVSTEQMISIDPMTAFPMVIIPTVFVPLLIVGHVISLTKIVMDRRSLYNSVITIMGW